ncbi:hypothetical protein Tco_1289419, partial [Tanacetum coccineum]
CAGCVNVGGSRNEGEKENGERAKSDLLGQNRSVNVRCGRLRLRAAATARGVAG